jgi:hypothetical protein
MRQGSEQVDRGPDAGLGRKERAWLDMSAVCLIALAFARGVAVTYDLDWPYDPDLYRDIAQAQTIVDGSFLADPHYLGETIWYNPLVPALTATLGWVTGIPLPVLETRSGAYLNVLGPVAFYLLTRALLGRWTAVIATTIFLFCTGDTGPSYASSTYSPWLFVANFVQALFYAGVLAFYRAVESNRRRSYARLGIVLGLTFLGHTAPAVILAGLVGLYTLAKVVREARSRQWFQFRRTLAHLGAVMALALIVSAPYLVSIVGRYRLQIVHRHPTFWIYPEMEVANVDVFLRERLSRTMVLPALAGLVVLGTVRTTRRARAFVCGWMGLSFAFVAYSYVWQVMLARGVIWPSVVPGFHFLRYFNAAESVLAGYGIVTVGCALARLAQHRRPFGVREAPRLLRIGVPLMLTAVLAGLSYPAYAARPDLTSYRDRAKQMYTGADVTRMFQWVRSELGPTDVVAAPENLALVLVGPAGRKVVVVDRFFSNPYVSWGLRHDALNAMLHALERGSCDDFHHVSDAYHVTHLLVGSTVVRAPIAEACGLVRGFEGREWIIYRRRR